MNERDRIDSPAPWNDEAARHWEEWRVNQEAANRAHDLFHQASNSMFESVISFGLEAIRSSALINGGAAVASIAFIGGALENQPSIASDLVSPLLWFTGGVVSAGLASSFAYASQFAYGRTATSTRLTFEHPYIEVSDKGRKWHRVGGSFHVLCVFAVLGSYAAMVCGVAGIASIIAA